MPSRSNRRRSTRPSLRSVRRAIEKSVITVDSKDLVKAFRASPLKRLTPYLLDAKFRVASEEAVKLYLKWSKVDSHRYVSSFFDCDDFAAALRGESRRNLKLNSVAEVWGFDGKHAYSAIAVHGGNSAKIRFIVVEPQSDGIVTKRIGTGMYKATRGKVIF